MSGLKVVEMDAAGNPTQNISVDGYVEVTENIILTERGFKAFVGVNGSSNPGARANRLQAVVQTAVRQAVVTTSNNNTPINSGNCQITAVPDVNHHPGVKAKHTVPMPPEFLNSLTYLDEYIRAFLTLWNTGQEDKARKFLYGIMMLTKCR